LYSPDMVRFVPMMIEHIIKVVFKVLVEQWGEDLVHVPLEAWWGVGEPKGHHTKMKGPVRSHEHGFPFISRLDSDLVVSRFQIELCEDL